MSTPICSLTGARGRSIVVYDNKCVITTDVTLGSILTNNALDGQKTIFYIDVKGIQFKKTGLTLGYLQLETSSVQMNNQSSNMFSENTFTFDASSDDRINQLMDVVHSYIVDRIESYKYNTVADEQCLFDLVEEGKRVSSCRLHPAILTQVQNRQQELKQQHEQELAAKKAKEVEAQREAAEAFRRTIGESGKSAILLFIEQAATCARATEILSLWKSLNTEHLTGAEEIEKKINDAVRVERMYGSDSRDLKKLLDALQSML